MTTYSGSFIVRISCLLSLALLGGQLAHAQTQPVCSAQVKEQAAKEIESLDGLADSERSAREAQIYEKYSFCAQDAQAVPTTDPFFVAARRCGAGVSQLGSIFFEEMTCCGYDPQRRQFACPITVKQRFGFGGAPLPGSREYVLNCVADNNGVLVPVALDSVHLANEIFGQAPPWQFAVIASGNQNLHTIQPMNGLTRRARSILSWGIQPNGCNFQPIWGNALNYRIRLDQ